MRNGDYQIIGRNIPTDNSLPYKFTVETIVGHVSEAQYFGAVLEDHKWHITHLPSGQLLCVVGFAAPLAALFDVLDEILGVDSHFPSPEAGRGMIGVLRPFRVEANKGFVVYPEDDCEDGR